MKMVAEGVRTTLSAHNLARRESVEMPISEQVYQVLYKNKSPEESHRRPHVQGLEKRMSLRTGGRRCRIRRVADGTERMESGGRPRRLSRPGVLRVRPEEAWRDRREKDPQYQYNLGLFYLNGNRVDEAMKYLDKSLSLNPSSYLAWNALGLARSMKGDLQGSAAGFPESHRNQPRLHGGAQQPRDDLSGARIRRQGRGGVPEGPRGPGLSLARTPPLQPGPALFHAGAHRRRP